MRLLLLLTVLSLTACAATKAIVQSQESILTEQDNKAVNVKVGQRFAVRVEENPTTGYVWAIEGQPKLFTLQSSEYVTDAHPNPQGKMPVGAGGQRSFVFVAQKAGSYTLKFKQWRPWLGDSSIVETFNVDIQVNEK
jgi:inhibitor of cysteine peptidase